MFSSVICASWNFLFAIFRCPGIFCYHWKVGGTERRQVGETTEPQNLVIFNAHTTFSPRLLTTNARHDTVINQCLPRGVSRL